MKILNIIQCSDFIIIPMVCDIIHTCMLGDYKLKRQEHLST